MIGASVAKEPTLTVPLALPGVTPAAVTMTSPAKFACYKASVLLLHAGRGPQILAEHSRLDTVQVSKLL